MITRPVIIVSPPRSGSTLLFETLSMSPDLWSIGGESHRVIEGIPALHPATRGWHSNRLLAEDADRETTRQVRQRFDARVRDRDGRRPPARRRRAGLRLLEKTPRNAVRVPFLASVFPRATFVYLHRDGRETMSSMLDGWRSGRYVSYGRLPGWRGLPWSFLLVPRWRSVSGASLADTVAHQWSTAASTLLDDLGGLPSERWCVVRYTDLVDDPTGVVESLCRALELRWDRPITGRLPLSNSTLTAPRPEKWRRNAAELEGMLATVAAVSSRAEAIAGART